MMFLSEKKSLGGKKTIRVKIWRTRSAIITDQTVIDSDEVIKQELSQFKRRQTLEKKFEPFLAHLGF